MVNTREGFVKRHPVTAYFALTFGISWMGALAVVAPGSCVGNPFLNLAEF